MVLPVSVFTKICMLAKLLSEWGQQSTQANGPPGATKNKQAREA